AAPDGPKAEFARHGVNIFTYEQLVARWERVSSELAPHVRFVLLDESHRAKNGDAQRTRAVVALARTSPRVLLLSGPPATSRPIDLHAQLALLDPAPLGTRREFRVR